MDPTHNTPNSPVSTHDSNSWRWNGHMSDGVGSTFGVEPLAHLSVDAGQLVLSGTRGNFRLPRSHVTKIGRGGFYPWFFGGIRIYHNLKTIPEELVFKPMGTREREIFARLQAMGYPVR